MSVVTVKSNHAMMIGLQDTLQGMSFSLFFLYFDNNVGDHIHSQCYLVCVAKLAQMCRIFG